MSKGSDTSKTILVAGGLCLVCSIIVSSLVVALRPQQAINAELDMKKNILMSAGLLKEGDDINQVFSTIETIVIDMETGEKVDTDVDAFDQVAASKDPKQNIRIPANLDVGGLSTRSKLAKVYLKRGESGDLETIILNVWGKGLWSTMYGFIALAPDTRTVKGFAYYSHGETPGLGGEVDNPNWKKQWIGKKVVNENYEPAFAVNKGTVDSSTAMAEYKVDGLSGATITGNGVTSSIKYWFGDHGYAKFLEKVRQGGI